MSIASPERGSGLYRVIARDDFVEVELLGTKLPEEVGEALIEDAVVRGWSRLLLDCSRVEFLTSMGLGALIRLDRQLRPGGGRLRLFGLNADLRELFAITRIDRVMQIFDDHDAAIAAAW